MKILRKIFSLLLISVIILGVLTGCAGNKTKDFQAMEDFEQARIGVLTGSVFDLLANEHFPEAEKLYYMNISDLILTLQQDKIDGILMDKAFYAPIKWEGEELSYIEMDMPATEYAVAFPKVEESEELKSQIDEFIQTQTENGWLTELNEKWFSDTEPSTCDHDMTQLTGENGTLRVATTLESKPFDYLKNGEYCGHAADFIYKFAKEYGYAVEIDTMAFSALLPSLEAERYDLAISSITVTEERKECVLFSDAYYSSPIVMAVLGNSASEQLTMDDFENATLGVQTGTVYDDFAKERFPNAKLEYYNQQADMIVAVEQGKIDGYLTENTYLTGAIWEGAKVRAMDEVIDHSDAGFIFQKSGASSQLREQMNTFIIEARESGLLDELKNKWFGNTEPEGRLAYESLTGENGTIKVAASPDLKPISYLKNSELTGYEIEIVYLFAKEYGYKLDIEFMAFDAILAGVTTGKYDIGFGAVTITEERTQSMDFSESHLATDIILAVKAEEDPSDQIGFFASVKESFHKTFIKEDRWKLIVEGIGVTMLISICATIAGTLLGFGLYMLSRSDRKLLQKISKGVAKVYSRIIEGTPVVVILMILFYIVFGQFREMSGVFVAIIGFTLTFGAFVYDHMTVSVNSIDRGQTEAAFALGYTKNKTFFRIIFPQAMNIFLPSYCSQAVELIKATAVVGYVAVNDLTKMGDIIRSNTYEAFFPLIATAMIYFILTWIISSLLKLVKIRFEPKRRSKEEILKGVKAE